jgi:hypothetical protein
MRALGEFFGHIAQGVRTPVNQPPAPPPPPPPAPAPPRQVTRHTVEEEQRDTPQGKVTLRRTVIEEVELPSPPPDLNSAPPSDR